MNDARSSNVYYKQIYLILDNKYFFTFPSVSHSFSSISHSFPSVYTRFTLVYPFIVNADFILFTKF